MSDFIKANKAQNNVLDKENKLNNKKPRTKDEIDTKDTKDTKVTENIKATQDTKVIATWVNTHKENGKKVNAYNEIIEEELDGDALFATGDYDTYESYTLGEYDIAKTSYDSSQAVYKSTDTTKSVSKPTAKTTSTSISSTTATATATTASSLASNKTHSPQGKRVAGKREKINPSLSRVPKVKTSSVLASENDSAHRDDLYTGELGADTSSQVFAQNEIDLKTQSGSSSSDVNNGVDLTALPSEEMQRLLENIKNFDAKVFLKTVPNRPGCYRMYDSKGVVIYVGKAKDLKKRLSSYFLKNVNSSKTRALVSNIAFVEFSVTFSETEALILENNLIKQYQPRYNILLRDDKSYPYLLLTKAKHPGLFYHRGPHKIVGDYFGPYPDSSAVKESLRLLQKIFPIRQCADNVYEHRSRPCLMAQIGKCLAPCVTMTEKQEQNYAQQVENVGMFLKGQNQELLNKLTEQMQNYSKNLEFEDAAMVRDQLLALRRVQEAQSVASDMLKDIDVIAYDIKSGIACVHILFIRQGRILGTRSYFPKLPQDGSKEELISSFLLQFYLSEARGAMYPSEIVLEDDIQDKEALEGAISSVSSRSVKILTNVREERAKYLRLAKANVEASLNAKLSSVTTAKERIESLESILGIKDVKRMECFDISHTQGESTVASCVVFNREGPDNSRYRRYNIEGITKGDDFAAMHQVLTRRFKDPKNSENPDIIFIDGGKGQLAQAEDVISKAYSQAHMPIPLIVAVAKGEGRKEGLETLIKGFSHEKYNLFLQDPALQLVLHIRDESHRFAITGHRAKRQKTRVTSVLEQIPGVGQKRRHALLQHLGGRQEIMAAGIDELSKVPGISRQLAEKIYDSLHSA